MSNHINKLKKPKRRENDISSSFLVNRGFLKKFIYRFFYNDEDIEDVIQETYLRAYVAEQKAEITNHKSFLFATAKNIALTKLTKKSKQVTDFLDDYSDQDRSELQTEPSAQSEVDARQQLIVYCNAIQSLGGKCREAFLLKKVHGMTNKEIARHMSMSLSSIEKYLHRAMITLDEVLSESEINVGVAKVQQKSTKGSR